MQERTTLPYGTIELKNGVVDKFKHNVTYDAVIESSDPNINQKIIFILGWRL